MKKRVRQSDIKSEGEMGTRKMEKMGNSKIDVLSEPTEV